jgi:hypothetical protein
MGDVSLVAAVQDARNLTSALANVTIFSKHPSITASEGESFTLMPSMKYLIKT